MACTMMVALFLRARASRTRRTRSLWRPSRITRVAMLCGNPSAPAKPPAHPEHRITPYTSLNRCNYHFNFLFFARARRVQPLRFNYKSFIFFGRRDGTFVPGIQSKYEATTDDAKQQSAMLIIRCCCCAPSCCDDEFIIRTLAA